MPPKRLVMLLPVQGGTTGGARSGVPVGVAAAWLAGVAILDEAAMGAPAGPATPSCPAMMRGSEQVSRPRWSSVLPLSKVIRKSAGHPVL